MRHEHASRTRQWTLDCKKRLYDNLFDVHHQHERVLALRVQVSEQRAHGPLVAVILHVGVRAVHIFVVFFIQTIIGEVHASVAYIAQVLVIFYSRKSKSKSIFNLTQST